MLHPPVSGEVSLDVYTRTPKHKAANRVDYFALSACARLVLRFLIARGRGKRCRSWWSARRIARALPRSGKRPQYSVDHVRRSITELEDEGLVRCAIVQAGETFPRSETPDVDGGGLVAWEGGRVREVNMAALLGLGPVWAGPVRRVRLVSAPASEYAERTELRGLDPEAAAAGEQLRALVALEALERLELAPDAPPSPPSEPAPHAEETPPAAPETAPASAPPDATDGPPSLASGPHGSRGGSRHGCRSDLGFPSGNHLDLGRAAPGSASPSATEAPANAGSRAARPNPPTRSAASPTPATEKQDERADAREVACGARSAASSSSPTSIDGQATPTENAARGREQPPSQHGSSASPQRPATADEIAAISRRNCPWLFGEQLGLTMRAKPRGSS